jgi:hypothetical protein
MNKKISFKHITGSMKFIPGIDHADMSPRLVQRHVTHPEAGAKPFPIQELVAGHIVHIVLVNEDYEPLNEADEKLPDAVKRQVEQDHANEMLLRRRANEEVRNILNHLKRTNQIELLGETEMSAEEVLETSYPILQLSAIALADHESRNIPIPANLQNPSIDTERLRAAADIAREKTEKPKVDKPK